MKAAVLFLLTGIGAFSYASETLKGFDVDEGARFSSVSVPVGMVQTAKDIQIDKALDSGKKFHSVKRGYFDKVVAIGLSPNEMKNLNVESGQLLEIQAGEKQVMASVYQVTGAASPPLATINLSPAAADRLKVKPGDVVVIHHPGDEILPDVVDKPTVSDYSTRMSDQSEL